MVKLEEMVLMDSMSGDIRMELIKKVLIGESKYGSSMLGNTKYGRQMSDLWVEKKSPNINRYTKKNN
jgi:hypothetical protein